MALLRSLGYADASLPRAVSPGDILVSGETIAVNDQVGAAVIPAAKLLNTVLSRTGTGGVTDTTDTASNLILAALGQQAYLGGGATTGLGLPAGTSWRLRYMNTTGGTVTVAAGTGVTLSGTMTLATVTYRDFLVTCVNGSLGQVTPGTTTNGSAVLTGMDPVVLAKLSVGMNVTGAGVPGSTTVIAVNPTAGTVTMSANATASATVSLSFFGAFTITNLGAGSI